MMLWLAILACTEPVEEVQVTGQVLTGLDSTTGAADIQVLVRDGETEMYSKTTTDEDGLFTVAVPATSVIHLELDGSEYVPTAFSTISGSSDFQLPVGGLWLRTPLEVQSIQSTFENCASVESEGGIIEGEVHFNAVAQSTETNLVAEEATVQVIEAEGTTQEACYLNNDGESDPDAEQVGATGRFVAFGIPPGSISVSFTYQVDTLKIENFGLVFLPEDGVGPFYPALIDLL